MVTPYEAARTPVARYARKTSPSCVRMNASHNGQSRNAQTDRKQTDRKPLVMRKYRISSLLADGQVRVSEQIGPAMPAFEAAFSAFAHGTLIATTRGQVPVEDLSPGMKLATVDQGPVQLLWVGAMTLMPRSDRFPASGSLTRIMADSFGFGRPQADVMAGPGARFLLRPSGPGQRFGGERALIPAAQLVDGHNAIEIVPPRPVTLYHLCLRRVRTLEEQGYIRGYHATVDARKLGFEVQVFAMVGLQSQAEADLVKFEDRCRSWPLVRECHMLNGEVDFILKCVAPDLSTFQTFLTEDLTAAENVASVKTSLVIRDAKDEPGVPFDVLEARVNAAR